MTTTAAPSVPRQDPGLVVVTHNARDSEPRNALAPFRNALRQGDRRRQPSRCACRKVPRHDIRMGGTAPEDSDRYRVANCSQAQPVSAAWRKQGDFRQRPKTILMTWGVGTRGEEREKTNPGDGAARADGAVVAGRSPGAAGARVVRGPAEPRRDAGQAGGGRDDGGHVRHRSAPRGRPQPRRAVPAIGERRDLRRHELPRDGGARHRPGRRPVQRRPRPPRRVRPGRPRPRGVRAERRAAYAGHGVRGGRAGQCRQ